jgi:hypothetical protein
MLRKIAPFALLIFGMLVMLGAFLYAAGNALPYQDPTAEMLAHQATEARKWSAIFVIGLLATASAGVWLWLRSRARRRAHNLQ